MKNAVINVATAAAVVFGSAMAAGAVTITPGPNPNAAILNPTATSTTGTVSENTFGSIPNVQRSPWEGCGCGVPVNSPTSYFTSVGASSSATYSIALSDSVSFLWGSPDNYNDLDIVLSGGGGTVTINGASIQPPIGVFQKYVTISDVGGFFDTITFRSGKNAFEFANLTTTPVPLPAALPLLAVGLGGLGVMKRRRKAN